TKPVPSGRGASSPSKPREPTSTRAGPTPPRERAAAAEWGATRPAPLAAGQARTPRGGRRTRPAPARARRRPPGARGRPPSRPGVAAALGADQLRAEDDRVVEARGHRTGQGLHAALERHEPYTRIRRPRHREAERETAPLPLHTGERRHDAADAELARGRAEDAAQHRVDETGGDLAAEATLEEGVDALVVDAATPNEGLEEEPQLRA